MILTQRRLARSIARMRSWEWLSTDRTRAMLVRLVGAVRSGKLRLLRGIPRRDMKHSKVAQEELLRDFAEDANGDASEFLK